MPGPRGAAPPSGKNAEPADALRGLGSFAMSLSAFGEAHQCLAAAPAACRR